MSDKKNWYVSKFETFEKSLNGEASSSIHAVRKSAIARFAELGFPTTRDEEWKFTDVTPLAGVEFKPVVSNSTGRVRLEDIQPFLPKGLNCHRLVCVNGHYSEELSSVLPLPGSVKLGGLADALRSESDLVATHLGRHAGFADNAFTALNTAFVQDGAFISIPDGTVLSDPIYILFVSTGDDQEFVAHPRNLILIGKNSQASIVEAYAGLSANVYFTNTVSEIVMGENAVIEHEKVQEESEKAFHINRTHIHQERNSNFVSNAFTFGGSLVRNDIVSMLDGEGAEATLNGLYLASGTQHIDNHTTMDHAKPQCDSHELYKGILAGRSRGVFNGKIFVRKDAQKTDAKQTNKNLLLSDDASIDTKPQLEIFANDVKCTHGATIGQLDEEQLFYLRARGIPADDARTMLIYAFASEVIDRVHVEALRERLHDVMHAKLRQGGV